MSCEVEVVKTTLSIKNLTLTKICEVTLVTFPAGYAQALHSVLLSCELNEGGAEFGGFTRKIVRTLTHHS